MTGAISVGDSDEALIRRCQKGDRTAFAELVHRTARLVFARAYLETGDAHHAEDVTQETFLRAWRGIGQVSDPSGFRTWLTTILHGIVIDSARSERRLKRRRQRVEAERMQELADDSPPPLEAVEKNEQRQRALDALRELPEQYREPLMLRYIAGADYQTISRQLALSNGSLRGLLHRGIAPTNVNVMDKNIEHAWFREHIETAIAGGFDADERTRFDAHAHECHSCATELNEARRIDDELSAAFSSIHPPADFEQRIIESLEETPRQRIFLHPAVRRAVTGVAAAVVLAGLGYAVTTTLRDGKPPDVLALVDRRAPALTEMVGGTSLTYQNKNRGEYRAGESATLSPQEMADAANGRMLDGLEIDGSFGDALAYAYQGRGGGGSKPQDSEGDVGSNEERFADAFGRKSGSDWTVNGPGAMPSDEPVSKEAVAKNLGYFFSDEVTESTRGGVTRGRANAGDEMTHVGAGSIAPSRPGAVADAGGHAEWAQTPFVGVNKDNINVSGVVAGADLYRPDVDGNSDLSEDANTTFSFKPDSLKSDANANGEGEKDVGFKSAVTSANGLLDDVKAQRQSQGKQMALAGQEGGRPRGEETPPNPAPVKLALAPPEQEPPAPEQVQTSSRKIIRHGVMEFEVEHFDAAAAQIGKLAQESGGYVATTDSEKLPNGKVRGTIVVRVPPERLDVVVLQFRGLGELKSQKLDAQDVTKQYTDLDSELRGARAMEDRLLEMIKTGKGEIKDLLAAEKELAVWRGKSEKIVGEMKYIENQAALSTLRVTLQEKNIRTSAAAFETETVDAGIETEDVEAARTAALKAIDEAKGRVIQSDLKRFDAGQFGATIVAEVPPDHAGPLIDRLKQLGRVARLDIQRRQGSEEGVVRAGVPVEKRDTRIQLSLYNLANVAPRQTTSMNLACEDVEQAYGAILQRVEKAGGRVVTSSLSRQKPEQTSGTISFEVPSAEYEAVLLDVRSACEVMRLAVSENPDTANVTAAKRGFAVQLLSTAAVAPRETMSLQLAARSVHDARNALTQAAQQAGARIISSQLNEGDQANITATLDLEVPRAKLGEFEAAMNKAAQSLARTVTRSADTENTIDSKARMSITLIDAERLPPRESTTLGIEVADVSKAVADLQAAALAANAKLLASSVSTERSGRSVGKIIIDVPLEKSAELISTARNLGDVRVVDSSRNPQSPDGQLARARIDVTFGSAGAIVSPERGIWSSIRQGLSTSLTGLAWSLELIVVGLCFIGPWALLIWGLWRFVRRGRAAPVAQG